MNPDDGMAKSKQFKRHTSPSDWSRIRFLCILSWSSLSRNGRALVLLTFVLVIGLSYGTTLPPLLFSSFIDAFEFQTTLTPKALWLIVGFLFVFWLSNFVRELLWVIVGPIHQRIQKQANVHFLDHVLSLPFQYHLEKSTGKLVEQLNQGQSGINLIVFNALTALVPTLLQTIFVILNTIIFLPLPIALIMSVMVVIYLSAVFLGVQRAGRFQRRAQKALIEGRGLLTDILLNIEIAKAFNREATLVDKYDADLSIAEKLFGRFLTVRFLLGAAQVTIMVTGLSVALAYTIRGVSEGNLSIGTMVLVQMYFLQTIAPLANLSRQYRDVKSGLAMLDGVIEVLSLPPTQPAQVADEPTIVKGTVSNIVFDKVTVELGGRTILREVSFEIHAGSTVAFVGPTGSGKSTIVRSILGLIDLTSGAIQFGETPKNQMPPGELLACTALVPQDTVLFHDTLENNLLFAQPKATRADLKRALHQVQLTELLDRLPNGIETQVGERGLKLSGGERQRIGLARALLRKPDLYIFDEATSGLDPLTEAAILADIQAIDPNATKIFITHRLNTVSFVDRVFVVQDGVIVEQGAPKRLYGEGGRYRALLDAMQREG
ncbi:ABC transporter ATP-binding protein [Pelagibius litoralis]|uniref:ABC transporter ATP-binding protein n=1 Tax=Pelagibius litoralis TaxID=374515 RepID=A0A967F1H6_9PROT|nr:ABC transporter ATP-binding protein [Pelagibius litoralis]NIA71364.1 ABC transporter ATP-binding protein [Pelagibius litoralis]